MPRIARIIVPGMPHHVTQRGNRRQRTFFSDVDYQTYLNFLFTSSRAFEFEVWSYCLMPNHIHLLLVPTSIESLRDGVSQIHQSYTRFVNRREKWSGHLWQGRFFSCPVELSRAASIARYIELNPVRAKLCSHPRDYRWSSAAQSCQGSKSGENGFSPLFSPHGSWEDYLSSGIVDEDIIKLVRKCSSTGRPVGSEKFIQSIEAQLGRSFAFLRPGPKDSSELIKG